MGNLSVYREIFPPDVLRVTVLEVGKTGNAVLVQDPSGRIILIDTGPDASILRALGTTLSPWQRTIDTVLLTDTKADVAGGLADVESYYHIKNVLRSGTHFSLDNTTISVLSRGTFTILYGPISFAISSSTPAGIYILNGKTITHL